MPVNCKKDKKMNTDINEVVVDEEQEQEQEQDEDEDDNESEEYKNNLILFRFYEQTITDKAKAICSGYNAGNGKYNPTDLPDVDWSQHLPWVIAFGLYNASKLSRADLFELVNTNAVSKKHSLLLAKASTGRYDFTELLAQCSFIHSVDTNLQSFRFKREGKNMKIDLDSLKNQLTLLKLELIIEEIDTRSGGKVTNYFYDIKTTKEA